MRDPGGAPLTGACEPCHRGARDFNVGGKQSEIQGLLTFLGDTLKGHNQLPGRSRAAGGGGLLRPPRLAVLTG